MKVYSAWLMCMTNTGVVFNCNIVFKSSSPLEQAGQLAVDQVLKNGANVTMQIGAPPIPVMVSGAFAQRVDVLEDQKIVIATDLKGLTH